MNIKKMTRYQMVVVAAALLCLAGAGAGAAYAATDNASGNPVSELVSAIAAKFNLNADDVQAVFDQQRARMETRRQAQAAEVEVRRQQDSKEILVKAVGAGKLTQAQADMIGAKEAELAAARTALQNKTAQERRTAMQEQGKALQQWLKDNNIPSGYLSCGFAGGQGVAGTVKAVSGNTITLVSKSRKTDSETTYTVDAGAALIKKTAREAGQSGKPVESTIGIGDIVVGDTLMVRGTVAGTNIDAITIIDGMARGRGMEEGHGRGFGPNSQ